MPNINEIPFETPSSSAGESDKFKKPTTQRKKKKVAKHGSQIPRINSQHRVEKAVEQSSANKFKEPSNPLVVLSPLKKSLSEMDMKQSKKLYNRCPSRNPRQTNISYSNYACSRFAYSYSSTSKDSFYSLKDNNMLYTNQDFENRIPCKMAGMKVFATIMLNSWRKRRDEVKRLTEEVNQLQSRSVKVKNQIHVLNSVFRNEQRQNEKLSRQLRHASDDHQTLQTSIDNLTASLINAQADASLYEQQYHAKVQENETLNNILTETNSELFKSMGQIRQLQTSLTCEQRNVQQLESQKNILLNELTLNEIKCKKEEEQHLIEIYHKDEELSKANSEIKMLEALLLDLKEKEFQVRDLKKSDSYLKSEIETLRSDVIFLRSELNKCFTTRFKLFWKNYVKLHRNTLTLIHIAAVYLLPAIPPPKTMRLPKGMSLDKVMSIIRD